MCFSGRGRFSWRVRMSLLSLGRRFSLLFRAISFSALSPAALPGVGEVSVIFSLPLLISGRAVHSRGRLSILVCKRVGIYPFYGSFVRVIYLCHTSISIRSICRTFLSRSVVPCVLSFRRFLLSNISLSTSTESDQQFVCRRS